MNKIYHILITGTLLLATACQSDFLDLEPLDTITDAAYFNEPEDFEAAANNFYNKMVSLRKLNESRIYDFMDFGSDLNALAQDYGRGIVTVLSEDKYWTNSYSYIRENNILLQKAGEYGGDETEIAAYVAAAKFFRAWHHFFLLQRFGGVPVITTVLDVDSPELYGKRSSRYEVIAQIISDLDDAIADLPIEQNIAADDKGHVSKWAAESFKARVLLYEATWEKYVGETTDGDGTTVGAGSQKPDSYPTVNEMLQEAYTLAEDVMTNGGYELWDHNYELNNWSMCYLFNLEDAESNPAGLDKSTNNEFILYNKYDYSLYQGQENISHTVGSRLPPSRKFMDMFLCTDGLPIAKSSLFEGYEKTSDEYQNRDYRLTSYFCSLGTWDIPADGSIELSGPGGSSGSGYECRKFCSYNYGTYRTAKTESFDWPQIRLSEVYLIYAEALYELNGTLTDDQLNASINKIKARAGLPSLTNAFLTANDMDLQEEIRRERAVELYAENSRYNDVKRWGIAEEALNDNICGPVIEGTDYEDNEDLYQPNSYPYGEITITTGVGERSVLLLDPSSNRNFQRSHYLYPLPASEIQQNNNLLQNVGY